MGYVLLVTWFMAGQPPANYQVEFSTIELCEQARRAVLAEVVRLRQSGTYGLQPQRAPGGGVIGYFSAGSPPNASAVCAAR